MHVSCVCAYAVDSTTPAYFTTLDVAPVEPERGPATATARASFGLESYFVAITLSFERSNQLPGSTLFTSSTIVNIDHCKSLARIDDRRANLDLLCRLCPN